MNSKNVHISKLIPRRFSLTINIFQKNKKLNKMFLNVLLFLFKKREKTAHFGTF